MSFYIYSLLFLVGPLPSEPARQRRLRIRRENQVAFRSNRTTENVLRGREQASTPRRALRSEQVLRQNEAPIHTINHNDQNSNVQTETARRLTANIHNETITEVFTTGPMQVKCQYCHALHFANERPQDGKFKSCCHKGKIKMPARPVYPEFLRNLLSNLENPDHRHFLKNIRSYNSMMSFASLGAPVLQQVPGRGPAIIRIQGQIYHLASHMDTIDGTHKRYGQLYTIGPTQALNTRQENPSNFNCRQSIMRELDSFIRSNNPYAQAYSMMRNVFQQCQEQANANNLPMPNVSMALKRDLHHDQRRFNLPTAENEVAMIFTTEEGEPPFERDINIYPSAEHNRPIKLNILSPSLDPMTYVLLYPYGESGWQQKLVLSNYHDSPIVEGAPPDVVPPIQIPTQEGNSGFFPRLEPNQYAEEISEEVRRPQTRLRTAQLRIQAAEISHPTSPEAIRSSPRRSVRGRCRNSFTRGRGSRQEAPLILQHEYFNGPTTSSLFRGSARGRGVRRHRSDSLSTDSESDQVAPTISLQANQNIPRQQENENELDLQVTIRSQGHRVRKRVNTSILQFKSAQIQVREGAFNALHCSGRLFQQWLIDSWLQIEGNNLNYIKYSQKNLRAENYNALRSDAQNQTNGELPLGVRRILPSSFKKSPRMMRQLYYDALAIVSEKGPPGWFLTKTIDPMSSDIKQHLLPGQTAADRPDVVTRVFRLELDHMMKFIVQKKLLGHIVAFFYVIEWQKRGLPHAHIVLIPAPEHRCSTAADIDKYVSAEIPSATASPRLFELVTKSMIHGPCGAVCIKDGSCSKKFPKPVQAQTLVNVNGYPIYRRIASPPIEITRQGRRRFIDNQWVVPYNDVLLLKYGGHINLEACTSLKVVKYLFKYITKGFDCADVEIRAGNVPDPQDEVAQFASMRYLCANEAVANILEHKLHDRSHDIIRLQVHLPEHQIVYFDAGNEQEALDQSAERNTTLTAWFLFNGNFAEQAVAAAVLANPNIPINPIAQEYRCSILYKDFPYKYVFNKQSKSWKARKQGHNKVISRMYSVSPRDIERFCLRLLLLHIPGAISFDDLKTVNGIIQADFKAAARLLGFFEDDAEWDRCLTEAAAIEMPTQLRWTFAFLLIFCVPANPLELWLKFSTSFTEDYARNHAEDVAQSLALRDIEEVLLQHRLNLAHFGLPTPGPIPIINLPCYDVIDDAIEASNLIPTLNPLQREAFELILGAVGNPAQIQRFFYLNGPGGSGKTYLYRVLMATIRGRGDTVLAHATTGIAAQLLKGGKTMHSGFKLPVPILENSTSSMRLNSPEARALAEASLIIIDEAPMMSTNALRCIDQLLKEIMINNSPFGGKVLVLGGDFCQTLPIVPHGSRADILDACIKFSSLWPYFTVLHLQQNMRTTDDQSNFNQWLLRVGNGSCRPNDPHGILPQDSIEIPEDMVEKNDIIKAIYGDSIISLQNIPELAQKVILTSTNKHVMEINIKLLSLLPGNSKSYFSVDSIDDPQDGDDYSQEFLNAQTPSGMAPHRLVLKVGAIVMLLRNMNQNMGLCNGTRLIITSMHNNFIQADIIGGQHNGISVNIPRINLAPSETNLPFVLKRRQLPIILAFSMTINKSQGQTFEHVGISLDAPVFAHGQLYVALSRCRQRNRIKVFIKSSGSQGALLENDSRIFTRNVVYYEVI